MLKLRNNHSNSQVNAGQEIQLEKHTIEMAPPSFALLKNLASVI